MSQNEQTGIFTNDYQPYSFSKKNKTNGKKKKLSATEYTKIQQQMEQRAPEYHQDLLKKDEFLKGYLKEVRGLSDSLIAKYQLGFTEHHPQETYSYFEVKDFLTIPIKKGTEIVNIRCHATKRINPKHPKDLPFASRLPHATYVFPEDNFKDEVIWLTEGEPDCLCAISHSLNAATVTCGAGTMPPELVPLFKGKVIYIVYDCDTKGKEGALSVARKLYSVAREIRIIDLGLKGSKEENDLTHFFVDMGKTKEDLEKLARETPVFKYCPIPDKKRGSQPEEKLEELLLPYWKQKEDTELLSAVAGYLLGLDWPWAMVCQLFQRIGKIAESEIAPDYLKELETLFRKWKREGRIPDSTILKNTLTGGDLETLERLAKQKRIPPEMRKIDNIRMLPSSGDNAVASFIKKRRIGEVIKESLHETGLFLHVGATRLKWFCSASKTVLDLDSVSMDTILDLRFGINPADPLKKYVLGSLRTEVIANGEKVKVYIFVHYDQVNYILYLYAGGGRVYRLDGEVIKIEDNGSEGVFFEDISDEACWEADLDGAIDPQELLINDVSFGTGKGVALSPEYQKTVLWLWMRSLFFEEIQSTKPIFALTGDPGSGKTTALRRILKFLFGRSTDVSELKNEDAWAPAITSEYLLVLDNLDKKIRWLPDKLDRLATGGSIQIRKLYETNVRETVIPRCFIALTSVNIPFSESTLADRMLLLRMEPITNRTPENKIVQKILTQRNQLWGGMLQRLNKDIQLLKTAEEPQVTFRMADWASLAAKLLAGEASGEEMFREIIKGLEMEQVTQVLENSIVPEIIQKWEPEENRWYTSTELFYEWKEHCDRDHIFFPFKGVSGLGKHLVNSRISLKIYYGLEWGSGAHNKPVYRFPKR